jgi:hypothetical protein
LHNIKIGVFRGKRGLIGRVRTGHANFAAIPFKEHFAFQSAPETVAGSDAADAIRIGGSVASCSSVLALEKEDVLPKK